MSTIPGTYTVRMLRQFLDAHEVPPIDRVVINPHLKDLPDDHTFDRPYVLATIFGGSEKLMRWLIQYDWDSNMTPDDRTVLRRAMVG